MQRTNGAFIYNEVIRVTSDYLGPAARRFVDRQISYHLGKQPEELSRSDVANLISWTSLAMGLLVEDEKLVKDYASNLKRLAAS